MHRGSPNKMAQAFAQVFVRNTHGMQRRSLRIESYMTESLRQ